MARPRKWSPTEKVCEYCGKVFHAKSRYQIKHQKFCNHKCYGASVSGPRTAFQRPCRKCGKLITVIPSLGETKHFCSYSCKNSFQNNGPGNASWAGGNGKYWKRKARERDSFTCQFPGCKKHGRGNQVHAHHKIPKSVGGPDSLENLVTLCSRHHREVERRTFVELVKKHPESTQEISVSIFGALDTARVREG